MASLELSLRRSALGLGLAAVMAVSLATSSGTPSAPVPYDRAKVYGGAGNYVVFEKTDKGVTRRAVFTNSWWTQGDEPRFVPGDSPWKMVGKPTVTGESGQAVVETSPEWTQDGTYVGGTVALRKGDCYRAKYWTRGDDPAKAVAHAWETPWERLAACPSPAADTSVAVPGPGDDTAQSQLSLTSREEVRIDRIPAAASAPVALPQNTPIVPAVVPTVQPAVASIKLAPAEVPATLPAQGYDFLRQVTDTHWNWMFPLRSGRYDLNGGTRNLPPFANPDGSTDVFNLNAFRKAVLTYNTWAKANGYKQFLNEGTLRQQAQEFLVFWAKSSRETSGSWSNAPAPWAEDVKDSQGRPAKAWKGGLYWVEEVGYSTNADGTSAAINYVDAGSTEFPPVAGRSYYGRGVIQLSWNYNYGLFSQWLFNNGMLPELITARDTLLKRPDHVATNGALSILSGIWFWMTPQGQKPSSHDVLYGDVSNISASGTDPGLPQLRTGFSVGGQAKGPTASGDSSDEEVMAFRLGSIINIVNGGLECNGAASWHGGPPQRVSYYNAYANYLNAQITGLKATVIRSAENVWESKVSVSSPEALQSATCFNQKSYYGW